MGDCLFVIHMVNAMNIEYAAMRLSFKSRICKKLTYRKSSNLPLFCRRELRQHRMYSFGHVHSQASDYLLIRAL